MIQTTKPNPKCEVCGAYMESDGVEGSFKSVLTIKKGEKSLWSCPNCKARYRLTSTKDGEW